MTIHLRPMLEWGGLALAGAIVALLVFVAASPWLLGWRFVVVAGGSMEPTIDYGSLAVMQSTSGDTVKPGDIILFTDPRQPSRVVTHRVVERTPEGLLRTRGDANQADDQWLVSPDQVRARYLFEVPAVGAFARWLRTPQGYLALVLVPGMALIGWELASIARALRRPRLPSTVAGR